jgi:hypothetical protein
MHEIVVLAIAKTGVDFSPRKRPALGLIRFATSKSHRFDLREVRYRSRHLAQPCG